MSRQHDPFQIPRAGMEAAPTAGLASIDLNLSGEALSGGEFLVESSLGGVAVYAIYQALFTALRTEALRQQVAIGRTIPRSARSRSPYGRAASKGRWSAWPWR